MKILNWADVSDQRASKGIKWYDEQLKKHMVYHLTARHWLPSLHHVSEMSEADACRSIELLIMQERVELSELQHEYVSLNGRTFSLEAFFMTYVHQLRNEFSALEGLLPQGYVYTIDPPSIFVQAIGNANLSNRLQILAFKYLTQNTHLENLKVVAFNDYADKGALKLWTEAMKGKTVKVVSKAALFQGPNGTYQPEDPNYALVLHNNSDGFGQNIEFERMTSMDGVIEVVRMPLSF